MQLVGLHIVAGQFFIEDLEEGEQLQTLTGAALQVVMGPDGRKIVQVRLPPSTNCHPSTAFNSPSIFYSSSAVMYFPARSHKIN